MGKSDQNFDRSFTDFKLRIQQENDDNSFYNRQTNHFFNSEEFVQSGN